MSAFRKVLVQDARRLGWLFLGWVSILALKGFGHEARVGFDLSEGWRALGLLGSALYWPWMLAMVMEGVLRDSPLRDDGFLNTRPVRRSTLMAGKLLLLTGVVVVPLTLAQAIALRGYGLESGRFWAILGESLVLELAMISLATFVAFVARRPAEFLAIYFMTILGYTFVRGALEKIFVGQPMEGRLGYDELQYGFHQLAGWGMGFAFFCALIVLACTARKKRLTLALGAAAVAAVALIQTTQALPIPSDLRREEARPVIPLSESVFPVIVSDSSWREFGGKKIRLVKAGKGSAGPTLEEVRIVFEEVDLGPVLSRSSFSSGFMLGIREGSDSRPERLIAAADASSRGLPGPGMITAHPKTEWSRIELSFPIPGDVALPKDWREHARLFYP